MTNGIIGVFNDSHRWNGPFLKATICPVVLRVPSGETATVSPTPAASAAIPIASIA